MSGGRSLRAFRLPKDPVASRPRGEIAPKSAGFCPLKPGTECSKRSAQMKSYKCMECRKIFKSRAVLVKHLKGHARDRSFKCPTCEKSFSKKSSLLIHQQSHTGSKRFACHECGKAFGQRAHLLGHSKTHLPKKTNNGKNHVKKDREEKTYRCWECMKTFVLHKNFINHQKIHAAPMPGKPQAVHPWVEQKGRAEEEVGDRSELLLEELTKMRQNVDLLLLNQQSQLQVLQEIQKQLGVLLPGNDLINSNVYSLGLLLGQQAEAMGSISFPFFLNPRNLLPESACPFSSQISS